MSIKNTIQPSLDSVRKSPFAESKGTPTSIPNLGVVEVTPGIHNAVFGYTYHRPDGNRLVAGKGNINNIIPLVIPLEGHPKWVIGVPYGEGSVWIVILDDGRINSFLVKAGNPEPFPININKLNEKTPPILFVKGNYVGMVEPPFSDKSLLTHPIPILPSDENLAILGSDSKLVLWIDGERTELNIAAIPDARILTDENGRILFLSDPTERYDHGVLGDRIEGGGFVLVETKNGIIIRSHTILEPPMVIEGISPIWSDLNGDGEGEIIVTHSDSTVGARIVVYDENGKVISEGTSIGTGYRWRHQLAVAPFGTNGELELAVIRTPHIGGILEFYRMVGDDLVITAQIPGFSTHRIGSRNLDNALAGDFDGDGFWEILLPDQTHSTLYAVRRTEIGAEIVWDLSLTGVRSSNIAAVTFNNGSIGIGVGNDNHELQLWLP